ncbi:MAG: pilus assembly protein [Actinobacteria bacterium]|nr:pilus assembly protein [Actinomycetota bacterium]
MFKKFPSSKNIINSSKGSALLEFALIAPVLFMLFAGIIQFGFIINAKVVVNSASFEGARAATMSDEPEASAAQAVLNYASSSMPGWNFSGRLDIETYAAGSSPGDEVTVKVTYHVPNFFNKIIPLPASDQISICGESTMQIEEKE